MPGPVGAISGSLRVGESTSQKSSRGQKPASEAGTGEALAHRRTLMRNDKAKEFQA